MDGDVVEWHGPDLQPSGDVALSLALLPAMSAHAGRLAIEGEVSFPLASNADILQDVFFRWLPASDRVELDLNTAEVPAGTETAVFFSGGVDSFYALAKHRSEVDRLVYVEGFDVPGTKPSLQVSVREALAGAARSMDLPLTVLSTNLREWSNGRIGWGMYHGAALASVGHLLSSKVGRVIVPSTYTYEQLFPWGSHPLTDPLWSGAVTVAHSGSEATRQEKVAAISDDAAARATLRVCWQNPDEAYNCGVCEKCLRTGCRKMG